MAVSTKIIRRRIRSVKNTKKITKAMELVSASKMRRAVQGVLLSRTYSKTAWEAVLNISQRVSSSEHELLLKHKPVKRVCYILFSSHRGLCGGLNSQIISNALRFSEQKARENAELQEDWVVLGKKGGEALARLKKNIIAEYVFPDIIRELGDIAVLAKTIIEGYIQKKYDEVFMFYTDFISALKQKPKVFQLLPFQKKYDADLGSVAPDVKDYEPEDTDKVFFEEYEFEPAASQVLDFFLKKLIEVELYQALLEATASEHSARMTAMRQASDAAEDMIDNLTLLFNQARQTTITREIAEISSGKSALE